MTTLLQFLASHQTHNDSSDLIGERGGSGHSKDGTRVVYQRETRSLPEGDRKSTRGRSSSLPEDKQAVYQRETGSLPEEDPVVYQRETGMLAYFFGIKFLESLH